MAQIELILLQRVEKLGQMGELVKVKPGYARNYLLPQSKAVRATKANRERFERERVQLEAQNLKRREEAERVAERISGLSVTLIRQASEAGALYGSVSSRDIADAAPAAQLAPARLANYKKMQKELAHLDRKTDPRLAKETKSKWKAIEKSVRSHPKRSSS